MEEDRAYSAHVVVLPFHGQGHINPMLQFSKRLASKGLKITIAALLSVRKSMQTGAGSVTIEPIYDDCIEGGIGGPGGFKGFLERFEASGKRGLVDLIKKLENSKYPVKCLVYDANLPWALICQATRCCWCCILHSTVCCHCQLLSNACGAIWRATNHACIFNAWTAKAWISKLGISWFRYRTIPPCSQAYIEPIQQH